MRGRSTVTLVLLVWLTFGMSSKSAGADPSGLPADVVPSSTALRAVLASCRRSDASASVVRSETWNYRRGEVTGTQTYARRGDDYRLSTQLGPVHVAAGRFHGRAWSQDENGYTIFETGLHERSAADEAALTRAMAGIREPGVSLAGQVSDGSAYVILVDPTGGRPRYVYLQATTCRVLKRAEVVEGRHEVTTYDDFRRDAAGDRPWHIHSSDGRPYNDQDLVLQSASDAPLDDQLLRPPSAGGALQFAASRTPLPAKIIDDRVIVSAEIAGRKINLQLDSGASGILLDESVTRALGLTTFGKSTEAVAGEYTAAHATVPRMTVGALTLSNVIVETAPFVKYADRATPVAGLLGFDFIAGCVIAIDYEAGTVEAIAGPDFQPPSDAIALSARLDDRVPVVSARVGTTTGGAFLLDTGADRSLLFSTFVAAHGIDTTDQGLGTAMLTVFPFIEHISGVGGEVQVRPVQVSSLGIGSLTLPHWLFDVTDRSASTFEAEDYDGIIGQDVLRNFVLYLDEANARVYLQPNQRFRQRWGTAFGEGFGRRTAE